jgi:hypothetical protein
MDMSASLKVISDVLHAAGRSLVLLHLSDEYGKDSMDVYGHPAIKHVFRNYWHPNIPNKDKVTILPLGFAKGRSAKGLPAQTPAFQDRKYVWSFAGSMDRQGRAETLETLKTVEPNFVKTMVKWGDPMAVDSRAYCQMLRDTKFAPCLRGFKALESYRIYEAMEHGCIPVYVPSESNGCADEFGEMYESTPFLAIPSWAMAAEALGKFAQQTDAMEALRQRVADWWNAKKEAMHQSIKKALGI